MAVEAFNHEWLVVDTDARPIGGPMGPLVVSWKEGQRMIAAGEHRAMELASCEQWVASWGTVPEGGAAWKLVLKEWRN